MRRSANERRASDPPQGGACEGGATFAAVCATLADAMDLSAEQIELEARARRALAVYRAEAFDNIDVAGLSARTPLPVDIIRWIGRRLALSARSTAGFQEGREIAAAADALITSGPQ